MPWDSMFDRDNDCRWEVGGWKSWVQGEFNTCVDD